MTGDPLVAHVTADIGNRILLPKNLADRVKWLSGDQITHAWLFLVSPGRMRLLSDAEVDSDVALQSVRELVIAEEAPPAVAPTVAESCNSAAMVARLVPVAINASKGLRIAIPKAFEPFASPEMSPRAFSVLVSLEGFLEIWSTDLLRAAVAGTAKE